ncbi:MAG: TIGR00730 family Rossman fold protein [Woeseiaceae bacterium]|nr:TIGR00730 family Rossman fold protein [Woeseiaceae bacterium]
MESVCVYCGSSPGTQPDYATAARELAGALLERGLALVYGGASKGLMGIIADAMLAGGGRVVGVIPQGLVDKEIAHEGLTELHVVASMHERKALMAELSDGFIAMPGGFGTLEEIVEMLTWGQLGIHAKPCGLLNVAGYYDGLLGYVEHAERQGFVRGEHRRMLLASSDPAALLARLDSYQAPAVAKWSNPAPAG